MVCFILKSQIIHDFLDNLPIYEGGPGFLHLVIKKCTQYYPLRPRTLDHNQKKTVFREHILEQIFRRGRGKCHQYNRNKYHKSEEGVQVLKS